MFASLNQRLVVAVGAAALGGWFAPAEAFAGDGFGIRVRVGDAPHWDGYRGVHKARVVHRRAVAEYRMRRVWVPPVYEQRVTYVQVPAVVEARDVPVYRRGHVVGYRTVTEVVEPARTEKRIERVLVREGYYKTIREPIPVRRVHRTAVRSVRQPVVRRLPVISGRDIGFDYHRIDHGRHRHRHFSLNAPALRISYTRD